MPPRTVIVRLRASKEELATTFGDYAIVCEKVLAYEHPVPNNVHCHLLLEGVYQTDETLKNAFRNHGLTLKGAGQVSYKTTFKQNGTVVPVSPETIPKYITYMSKGQYAPCYNKGYSSEEIEACKAAWVEFEKYKKPTRNKILLTEFYEHLWDYSKLQGLDVQDVYTNIPAVRTLAISFVADRGQDVLDIQARKDASMLYTSVCYKSRVLAAAKINLPFERMI